MIKARAAFARAFPVFPERFPARGVDNPLPLR